MKKRKIINDPVHGFINIDNPLFLQLIEHKYFQRLRRIKQLGLTNIVFPGASHTRFEHALGSFHLTKLALDTLLQKGVDISDEETEATLIAILLHDIGHGPFSHVLENSIIFGVSHEALSLEIIKKLNKELDGQLDLAIKIFENKYHKSFLHQLVSSQLDMDRLDYLTRDTFYTGVSEGVVGADRIIKMLDVRNDMLVVEEKGIYSVEKFLIARRLMYWQVYLHKTVLSAEMMLVKALQRARELINMKNELFTTPAFDTFLKDTITYEKIISNDDIFAQFLNIDDCDIQICIKHWSTSDDTILATLADGIHNRRLFKIEMSNDKIEEQQIKEQCQNIDKLFPNCKNASSHFVICNHISNMAYHSKHNNIHILSKKGNISSLDKLSDINIAGLHTMVEKHFICYPKIEI
ncbi:MAG: HD domain-containing protein [Bacteroidales bacterium]